MSKRLFLVVLLGLTAFSAVAAGWVGAGATLALPSGGAARLRRLGGGEVSAGYYLGENWAMTAGMGALENAAALRAGALWHWQGNELYGDLFGYSRFDPFFTFGLGGPVGHRLGAVGPYGGIGAFYHLSDAWSLGGKVELLLDLDGDLDPAWTFTFGAVWSFR